MLQNKILIKKAFKYIYGLKVSLPNQDLAYSKLRTRFVTQIISHMNIHSRSNLKFINFNTGKQSVLDL